MASATIHADALTIRGGEIACNADPIDATCVVDLSVLGGVSPSAICGLEL